MLTYHNRDRDDNNDLDNDADNSVIPTDDTSPWQVVACKETLQHVKPDEPTRQLGLYFSTDSKCEHQLEHIKKKIDPELACLASTKASFAEAELVTHVAIEKQALYGLKFTTITEKKIAAAMAPTRAVFLHKAGVARTEPRNLTGAHGALHGLDLRNWEVANIANKIELLVKT